MRTRIRKVHVNESDAACPRTHLKLSPLGNAARPLPKPNPRPAAWGSTAQNSLSDTDSILGADFQEHPFQCLINCMTIGPETTYYLEFNLPALPDSFSSSINLQKSGLRPCQNREEGQVVKCHP